jgi:hypothetical protein
MPKVLFVTHIYQVTLPDDRAELNTLVDEDYHFQSDADVVTGSDEALAVWLSYKVQIDYFRERAFVPDVEVIDVTVDDKQPDVTEFTLFELP